MFFDFPKLARFFLLGCLIVIVLGKMTYVGVKDTLDAMGGHFRRELSIVKRLSSHFLVIIFILRPSPMRMRKKMQEVNLRKKGHTLCG